MFLIEYLPMKKYVPFEVDAHLNDDNKEEADHAQHDDAQEDAQPLCGIEPEESKHNDGIGDAGADSETNLGAAFKLIGTGDREDSIETSGPAVRLEERVADADTRRHDPTDQSCVENCQAVLVPETLKSLSC